MRAAAAAAAAGASSKTSGLFVKVDRFAGGRVESRHVAGVCISWWLESGRDAEPRGGRPGLTPLGPAVACLHFSCADPPAGGADVSVDFDVTRDGRWNCIFSLQTIVHAGMQQHFKCHGIPLRGG